MTDERYKKIMADLGMPNSRSLLVALQQVANEAGQAAFRDGYEKGVAAFHEAVALEREECAALVESRAEPRVEFGILHRAAGAIRMRSND